MQFNSAIFIVFFLVVYLIYWNVKGRGRLYTLFVASMLFFAWYSPGLLLLFLSLIYFNYFISASIIARKSRSILAAALIVDVGLLAFFKYFFLFAQTLGLALGSPYLADLRANWLKDFDFTIMVPIGVSFYTFQLVAYLVDCYRGSVKARPAFLEFFVFNLFFPKLITGPILRHDDLIPQLGHEKLDSDKIVNGMLLVILGVLKKVLIADRLSILIAPIWSDPGKYDAVFLILILPGYVAQIFCDFSGYTDIARGLAKMLGYEIPDNFAGPLLAGSMRELWQRWHMTLSHWLRDYVYFPLGGSKKGEARTYINLMITMGLGGLWHGANWTMLYWGLYMGVVLVIERIMDRANIHVIPQNRAGNILRTVITFSLFSISAAFFASPSLSASLALIKGIVIFQRGIPGLSPEGVIAAIAMALGLNALQYYPGWKGRLASPRLRYGLAVFFTFFTGFLVNLYGDVSGSFIYFNF